MEQDSRMKALLEKYWLAETSDEEEVELKAWLAEHPIPENPQLNTLFQYFREEKKVELDAGFDKRITSLTNTKSISIRWLSPLLKIAAALIIIFTAAYFLSRNESEKSIAYTDRDTYSDPQQAYQETKRALLLVSERLNTGNSYVSEIKKINEAEKIIQSNTYHK